MLKPRRVAARLFSWNGLKDCPPSAIYRHFITAGVYFYRLVTVLTRALYPYDERSRAMSVALLETLCWNERFVFCAYCLAR